MNKHTPDFLRLIAVTLFVVALILDGSRERSLLPWAMSVMALLFYASDLEKRQALRELSEHAEALRDKLKEQEEKRST